MIFTDVRNAHLNGEVDEDKRVFVRLPPDRRMPEGVSCACVDGCMG